MDGWFGDLPSARPDAFLKDPECVRIYDSVAYDYERNFGRPDASHPTQSRIFDDAVRPWMKAHPGGTVVELGAGLETQFQRCDDGQVGWLCVDVPEAAAVREDSVDSSRSVFVTAQGLFMYFKEADTRRLLTAIVDRFPGVQIMLDAIPRWFSRKTLQGFSKTEHYRVPPMPWGVNRNEIGPPLRGWSPYVRGVSVIPYGFVRGLPGLMVKTFAAVPGLRNATPCIAHVWTQ
jgi:O-methyltransferase involved in polyketide biosynthesis